MMKESRVESRESRASDWLVALAVLVLVITGGLPVLFGGRFVDNAVAIHFAVVGLVLVLTWRNGVPRRGLTYGLFASVLVCLWGSLAQVDPQTGELMGFHLRGDRVLFPFAWPGGIGCFAAMAGPILFAADATWMRVIGVVACVAVLVLAGSKAALLGSLAATLIMLRGRAFRVHALACFALAVLIAIAVIPRQPGSFITSRVDYWHAAILTIADHPFLGVGAGGFGDHFTHYLPNGHYARFAHCDPLHLAAEHGIWAGGVYVALIGYVLARGWHSTLDARPSTAALSAFATCSLFDYPLYAPSLAILAALIAGSILAKPLEAKPL
jgi:O-antigen ligase